MSLTHGACTGRQSRLYKIWADMKQRCNNPNRANYHRYGGRGIGHVSEWNAFENFAEWAESSGYRDDLTLDRIDNDGNYAPSNCRWVPAAEQARNMRSNRRITYQGRTQTAAEWARELGVKHRTVINRLDRGESAEFALETVTKPRERYITFLRKNPGATVLDVAKAAGVPEQSARMVLHRMLRDGVAKRSGRGVRHYPHEWRLA